MSLFFMGWGTVFVTMAQAAFFSMRKNAQSLGAKSLGWAKSLLNETRDLLAWVEDQTQSRRELTWIGLFMVVGLVLRMCFAFQSMRYDEAYTFSSVL